MTINFWRKSFASAVAIFGILKFAVKIELKSYASFWAENGGYPNNIKNKITPSDHISHYLLYGFSPVKTSGDT